MALNIWQQLANSSPRPAPKRTVKRLTKPRGVYTKGPVRSSGTRVSAPKRKPAPVAHRSAAPARTPSYARGSTGSAGASLSQALMRAAGGPLMGGTPTTAALLASLRGEAAKQVDMELNPQIGARQFAFNQARSNYGAEVNEANRKLGLTKAEITQLYGALDALLQDTGQKRTAALDTAKAGATSAYDQLQQMVNSRYGGAQQAAAAEAARLGQGSQAATERLAGDAAFAQQRVGQQRAAATSTIDAIKAAATSEGTMLRGAAAATAPMLSSQATMRTNDQNAQSKRAFDQQSAQLKFEIAQLKGSRAGKIDQLAKEMQAAQIQAQQDAQQLAFLNSIKAAEVGISQGQLDLARQRLSMDASNSQNNLVLQAKKLQLAQQQAAAKASAPQTGMERAYTYLQGAYGGSVPQAQLRSLLEDAINGNSNDPGWNPAKPIGPGAIPGYDPKYLDQYLRDINDAVRSRGWSNTELNLLRNAASRYLKR